MSQTRTLSALEAGTSALAGLAVAFAVQITAVSPVRGHAVRRPFARIGR